ncbi:hypothetical protein DPMN_121308 [Dreissena polymorpha]|uniref:Uncharacterized protein n=1 Tax=Dreissena polymorpha TaxID=45954 RepID=A0A9D4GQ94_DREPO|nr:hypothetical protein DPMN_121308 [Dreissena polymorpha]
MSSLPGGHVFQQIGTICVHIQDIIKTTILTKFHADQTINVTKSVNKTNAPPPGRHVFNRNEPFLNLKTPRPRRQYIIGTNLLIMFPDDRTINMASGENALPPRGHVFQETGTIFHDHQTINVASRPYHENAPPSGGHPIRKNSPPSGGNVFQATGTIFELVQYIIGTNLLTRFYDDRTMHVASRVYTGKNAPPPGGTVLQPTRTIFKLVQDIIGTNLLTRLLEDRINNANVDAVQRTMDKRRSQRRTILLR